MTVEPGGAPMMPPIRSPAVKTESHQPSPHARAPRVAHSSRELLQSSLGLGRHRAERVVDQVRRRLEDREAIAVVDEFHARSIYKRQIAVPVVCETHTGPNGQHDDRARPGGDRRHDLHRRRIDDHDVVRVDARHPQLARDDRRAERVAMHLGPAEHLQRARVDPRDDVRLLRDVERAAETGDPVGAGESARVPVTRFVCGSMRSSLPAV